MPSTIAGTRRRCGLPSSGLKATECTRDRHGRLRLGFVSPDLGRHPVGYFLIRVLENLSQGGAGRDDLLLRPDRQGRLDASSASRRDPMARRGRHERPAAGGADPGGPDRHPFRPGGAHGPQPAAGLRPQTGPDPDHLDRLRRHDRPGGDGLPACRPLRGPGRKPSATIGSRCCGCRTVICVTIRRPQRRRSVRCRRWRRGMRPSAVSTIWPRSRRKWWRSGRKSSAACPTARLVLKYRGLGDPTVKRRYLDLFAAHGVEPQRLELLPSSSYAEYLADVSTRWTWCWTPFLFPAAPRPARRLWMGVPVVTCPGETFASRHSLSHLSNMGLTETIARDLDEYVELAVSLAATCRGWPRCGRACGSGWLPRRFATGNALRPIWQPSCTTCSVRGIDGNDS